MGEYVALGEAALSQACSDPVNVFRQLRVGDRVTGGSVDDRRLVALLASAPEDELGERQVRNLDVRERAANHHSTPPRSAPDARAVAASATIEAIRRICTSFLSVPGAPAPRGTTTNLLRTSLSRQGPPAPDP